MNPNPNPKIESYLLTVSWFASHEQAPLQDPPTEPRAIRSHAAPAEGPAEAHQRAISGAHAAHQAAAGALGRGPLRTAHKAAACEPH